MGTCVDLFCGAGGMAEGFRQAGFDCLWANDFEEEAMDTFRLNHPNCASHLGPIEAVNSQAIRKQIGLKKGELTVLVGGPPCQGFSTYGRRDPTDKRNGLFAEFVRFAEELKPSFLVIENVVGILSMEDGRVIDAITQSVSDLGYDPTVWTLDAADYGVPQRRKRVFVVAARRGSRIPPPTPTHHEAVGESSSQRLLFEAQTRDPWLTVRDAISDLPEEALLPSQTQSSIPYREQPKSDYQKRMRSGCKEVTHHSSKRMLAVRRLRMALLQPGDYGRNLAARVDCDAKLKRIIKDVLEATDGMRSIEECRTEDRLKEKQLRRLLQSATLSREKLLEFLDSGGFANKYRRLQWHSPSHTLVAHMARDCSDFVHPEFDRFISVREAARLQSFPDRYAFPGSQFRQFRQIGNAVPPALGFAVAREIAKSAGIAARQPTRRRNQVV
jgi:DNA (cytosine-5)-methyltransferase 1